GISSSRTRAQAGTKSTAIPTNPRTSHGVASTPSEMWTAHSGGSGNRPITHLLRRLVVHEDPQRGSLHHQPFPALVLAHAARTSGRQTPPTGVRERAGDDAATVRARRPSHLFVGWKFLRWHGIVALDLNGARHGRDGGLSAGRAEFQLRLKNHAGLQAV